MNIFNSRVNIAEKTVGKANYQSWAGQKIILPGGGITTKMEMMAAMLNRGNVNNIKALMNHPLFGDKGADLAWVESKTTRQEWEFIQGVWDFFDNTIYPEMNRLTKRTDFVPLEKDLADPFTVRLADGSTMDMRGGYYPIVWDNEMSGSFVINQKMREEELKNLPSLVSPNEVRASSTIRRTGKNYKGRVPKLDLGVMIQTLNDNIYDLSYREAISDTWWLLKNPDVKNAIEAVYGADGWLQAHIWLRN